MLQVVSSYWVTCNMMHETYLKPIQLHHSHFKQPELHSLQRSLFLAVFLKRQQSLITQQIFTETVFKTSIHCSLPYSFESIPPAANQLSDPYGLTSLHTPMNPKHSITTSHQK